MIDPPTLYRYVLEKELDAYPLSLEAGELDDLHFSSILLGPSLHLSVSVDPFRHWNTSTSERVRHGETQEN